MNIKFNSWKWFCIISSIILNAISLAPATFHIPLGMRPWIFVVNIFWFLSVCSGIYN